MTTSNKPNQTDTSKTWGSNPGQPGQQQPGKSNPSNPTPGDTRKTSSQDWKGNTTPNKGWDVNASNAGRDTRDSNKEKGRTTR